MRRWLTVVFTVLLIDLYAQVSDYRTDKLEGLRLGTGDMIMGKSLSAPDIVGSRFLYDDWLPGNFSTFSGDQYGHVKLKYDVEHNVLAAIDPSAGKEYYLANSKIKEFLLKGRRFLNKSALSAECSQDEGFVEVPFHGRKLSVIKVHFIQTLKPTYKEGIDMGTRDFRIVKKEELQIFLNNTFAKVPARKSDFVDLFVNDAAVIEKYLKSEKLNFKLEIDLKQLAAFYDQLEP